MITRNKINKIGLKYIVGMALPLLFTTAWASSSATGEAGWAQTSSPADATDVGNKKTYKNNFWFNIAGGAGFPATGSDFWSSEFSFNWMTQENQLLTLRVAGDNFSGSQGNRDVGILYGLIGKGDIGYLSGSVGVAYTQAEKCTSNDSNSDDSGDFFSSCDSTTTNTIGIPLEIQAFLTPFTHVGIGLIGFGNINSQSSFGGVMLALQLGTLK